MANPRLKTVTGNTGNNEALRDGTVSPRTFAFEFEDVPVLAHAFRRMVRELAYDICEMAFTTYLVARATGKRFTALPIFLVRAFHHGAIVYNTTAGISSPQDLEGKRVGVNRGYTVTSGVWARGILQDEHDVDLSRVTWVLSGDEHVAEFQPPDNVVTTEQGIDLRDLVATGGLPAAIGIAADHPDVEPLIPDATAAGLSALRRRGLYPINHLLVVKDDILAAHPELAGDVFETFAEAKRQYLGRLRDGRIANSTPADEMYRRVMEITGDPLPYGIEPNRQMIDQLVEHAVTQRILERHVVAEDLFVPDTHHLTA